MLSRTALKTQVIHGNMVEQTNTRGWINIIKMKIYFNIITNINIIPTEQTNLGVASNHCNHAYVQRVCGHVSTRYSPYIFRASIKFTLQGRRLLQEQVCTCSRQSPLTLFVNMT